MFGQFFLHNLLRYSDSVSPINVVGFTFKDRGVDLFPRQLRAMLFNKCSGRDEAWVSAFFCNIGIVGVHRQDLTLSSLFDVSLLFFERVFISTRLPQCDSTVQLLR